MVKEFAQKGYSVKDCYEAYGLVANQSLRYSFFRGVRVKILQQAGEKCCIELYTLEGLKVSSKME